MRRLVIGHIVGRAVGSFWIRRTPCARQYDVAILSLYTREVDANQSHGWSCSLRAPVGDGSRLMSKGSSPGEDAGRSAFHLATGGPKMVAG